MKNTFSKLQKVYQAPIIFIGELIILVPIFYTLFACGLLSAKKLNVPFLQVLKTNKMLYCTFVFIIILFIFCVGTILKIYELKSKSIQKDMNHQKDLQAIRENAEKESRSKTIYMSNMSHDIRTLLNAILGYTYLAVKDYDQADKLKEYLKKVTYSGDHLLTLMNDIFDMNRIEDGKISICERAENLTEIIKQLENIVIIDTNNKDISIVFDVSEIEDENIYCDRLRLNQILLNIISNSVKYLNSKGTVSIKVSEKYKSDEGFAYYEFCIKDNGIGMDEETMKAIFEPYIHNDNANGVKGTAPGMRIVKSLIDTMGGSVDVKSEIGKGTEIIMTFEFKIVSESNQIFIQNDEAEINLKGKKIIVVDDNDFNREIATLILENEGVIVTEAKDGDESVEIVKNSKPGDFDLILMDIQMPNLNGHEATKQIRALENPKLANIPIVAMTANAFDEDKIEALGAGMNEHIAKPLDMETFKSIISKIIG